MSAAVHACILLPLRPDKNNSWQSGFRALGAQAAPDQAAWAMKGGLPSCSLLPQTPLYAARNRLQIAI